MRKLTILILAAVFVFAACASTYEVSLNVEDEETGTVSGSGSYKSGEEVTAEAVPAPGYQFQHWTEAGEIVSTEKIYHFNIEADCSLTAVFAVKEYLISAEANDQGLGLVNGGGAFRHGEAVTVTAEPYEHCVFIGWKERGSVVSTELAYHFNADKDRNLVAEFRLEAGLSRLTATSHDSEKGTVTGAGIYETGKTVTVSAQPKEGFWFDSWTENGQVVSYNQDYAVAVDADMSLTANFVDTEPEFQETKILWEAEPAPFDDAMVIGGRMLTLSRTAVSCLDLKTGKILWSRDYSQDGFHVYWEDTVWSICYRVYSDSEITYTLVDEERVYIEQVELSTGKVLWRTQLDMASQGRYLSLGQEDEGQDLRLSEIDGLLWVNRSGLESWHLDLATGKEVEFLADKHVFTSGESYYTSTITGPVVVSKFSTAGSLIWQTPLEGKARSTTGISDVSGNVVLCTASADGTKFRTLALDILTGKVLWDEEGCTEGIHNGKAFVATASKLTIVELESGEIVNQFNGSFTSSSQEWVLNFIVRDDTMYFRDNDTLEAVDNISGKALWSHEISGLEIFGRIADDITKNPIFRISQVLWLVAGEDMENGTLTAIDRQTGDIVSAVPFSIIDFMWGNKDQYIFADKNGKPLIAVFNRVGNPEVDMLDGLTGQLLWSYDYKERAIILPSDGDYVALCSNNEVVFLRTRTGEDVSSFRVVGSPMHLAGNSLVVVNGSKVSLVQPVLK